MLPGIFLAALDQTIVGTALPVIVTDLKGILGLPGGRMGESTSVEHAPDI